MDRKVMMSEVVGARQEMGLEEIKNLTKMATKRLETLHIHTMEEYSSWTKKQMEQAEQDGLIENPADEPEDDSYLVFDEANPAQTDPMDECPGIPIITTPEEKENDMAKKEEKKTEKKAKRTGPVEKPEKFKVDDRTAFQAVANTVWTEEDRPDIASMSDDQIVDELKESLALLAPEDQVTVEQMDHGKEIWAYLVGLRKDLSEAVAPAETKKKGTETKKREKKEKIDKGPSPVFQITCLIACNPDSDLKEIKTMAASAGIKTKDSTIAAEFSNMKRAIAALKIANRLQ